MASVNLPISKHHELRIVNTEVIVPALPMRQHILPLSNIDLTIPPLSVHVFFCYKSSPSPRTFASALSHLKTSLSRVLVSYYVFAGRIVIDGLGLPKINCNNKGVRLTQAYALCPREFPTYSAEIEKMYVKYTPHESSHENQHPPSLASRIYFLDAKNVIDLQCNANKYGNKYTKLEVFSAYLWKLLVRNQKAKDTVSCSKIGIVVDGRPRLREIGVSANYFGNLFILPFAESNSRYVENEPLCCSAGLIHGAIQSAANEEHFQSLIDLVETRKPTLVVGKIYGKEDSRVKSSGPAVLVSSGLRFPLYEVDFGWGRPAFGSYHFPWGGEAGYVMPTQSPAGDGSWMVYMHLPLEQLYAIESDPNRLLFPIIHLA